LLSLKRPPDPEAQARESGSAVFDQTGNDKQRIAEPGTTANHTAWFTEAKIAELTERFGARPRLTWDDTHVTVDNVKGETRVSRSAMTSTAESIA